MEKFDFTKPELHFVKSIKDGSTRWSNLDLSFDSLSLDWFINVDDFVDFVVRQTRSFRIFRRKLVWIYVKTIAAEQNADQVLKKAWKYLRNYLFGGQQDEE
jgi:hypothetical protein